jgi:hypothetical protein
MLFRGLCSPASVAARRSGGPGRSPTAVSSIEGHRQSIAASKMATGIDESAFCIGHVTNVNARCSCLRER